MFDKKQITMSAANGDTVYSSELPFFFFGMASFSMLMSSEDATYSGKVTIQCNDNQAVDPAKWNDVEESETSFTQDTAGMITINMSDKAHHYLRVKLESVSNAIDADIDVLFKQRFP